MNKTAIFVDGAFFIKRQSQLFAIWKQFGKPAVKDLLTTASACYHFPDITKMVAKKINRLAGLPGGLSIILNTRICPIFLMRNTPVL